MGLSYKKIVCCLRIWEFQHINLNNYVLKGDFLCFRGKISKLVIDMLVKWEKNIFVVFTQNSGQGKS